MISYWKGIEKRFWTALGRGRMTKGKHHKIIRKRNERNGGLVRDETSTGRVNMNRGKRRKRRGR